MVMETAITGRETPQARPRAVLEGTKTYGTWWSANVLTSSAAHVLVLAKKREVKDNLDGLNVAGENDDLGDTEKVSNHSPNIRIGKQSATVVRVVRHRRETDALAMCKGNQIPTDSACQCACASHPPQWDPKVADAIRRLLHFQPPQSCSQVDQLNYSPAVQRLGCLVCAFLNLPHVPSLLDEIQELRDVSEVQRPSEGQKLTWFVSWALAMGKALELGAAILSSVLVDVVWGEIYDLLTLYDDPGSMESR